MICYYFCQTICMFCLVMICFDGYLLYYNMYAGPGTRFSLSLSNGKGVTRQCQYGNKCSATMCNLRKTASSCNSTATTTLISLKVEWRAPWSGAETIL